MTREQVQELSKKMAELLMAYKVTTFAAGIAFINGATTVINTYDPASSFDKQLARELTDLIEQHMRGKGCKFGYHCIDYYQPKSKNN